MGAENIISNVWAHLLDFVMGIYNSIYTFFNSKLFWEWFEPKMFFSYYDIVTKETVAVELSVGTLMLGSGILVMMGVWVWKWVKQIII